MLFSVEGYGCKEIYDYFQEMKNRLKETQTMQALIRFVKKGIKPEQLFMLSVLLVNGGNYLYNLVLGRVLGPENLLMQLF